jgi:serine/threonine protein kinase/Tol biopolymer transport system component
MFLKSAETKPPRSVHRLDEPAGRSLSMVASPRCRFRFARQKHCNAVATGAANLRMARKKGTGLRSVRLNSSTQMALSPGDQFGPYLLIEPIGRGGMGEVWKARDTRLDRIVAMKFSQEEFSERFEREAKAISSLNHPKICQLYDVGHDYLVMEYLEGTQLKGPLPLDQALQCGAQICDALDHAHRKGITHRDLKPANILLTKAGIKLLDFGIAKLASAKTEQTLDPGDATLTMALTGKNEIVGTPYYMSPEQLQSQGSGQEIDSRSDIFSFGIVLYEILTGKRAFEGASPASVIAAIMERPAPSIAEVAPAALDRLLKRCLEKDPDNRWQTARDLKAELDWIANAPVDGPPAAAPAPTRLKWLWPATAGLFAVVAAAALWAWAGRTPPVNAPTRLSVLTPPDRPVLIQGTPTRTLAISPDGTQLVYVAADTATRDDQPDVRNRGRLQLRRLNSLEVRDLPGTDGASQPFFSPDGNWVAFFTRKDLRKISVSSGNPITLAENITEGTQANFGVWTQDDTIIFSTSARGLTRVSAEGGAVTMFASEGSQPALVPSSPAVLFEVSEGVNRQIEAIMPDSGKRTLVLENAQEPFALSSGHLVFQRDGDLFFAPFDAKRLTITGSALPLGEQIRHDSPLNLFIPQMAISGNGTLAYLPALDTTDELGLVARDGTFQPLALPPGIFDRPRVSPDGRSIAYFTRRGFYYVYDVQRGSTVKRTQEGRDLGVAWHPDGRSLAINSVRKNGARGIFLSKPDGSEQLLVPRAAGVSFLRNFSWSPDGSRLAYTVQRAGFTSIWILTLGEKPPTQAFIKGQARSPRFSPDGKWLAYESGESGRNEVYIQQYPQGERIEVSTGGGDGPVWRRDGKELFFLGYTGGPQKKMMAVSVTPNGASLRLGKPVTLFDLRTKGPAGEEWQYADANNNAGQVYDILPDGRFVMVRGAAPADIREIVVVQNWFEELKRRMLAK